MCRYRVPDTELGEQPRHLGNLGQHDRSHTGGQSRRCLQGAPQGVPGGAANQLYSVINDDKHEERVNVNVTGREDRGLRDMASL